MNSMGKRTLAFAAVGSLAAITGTAPAQNWDEVGDAGDFPAGAFQDIVGVGPLSTITGSTNGAGGDYIDSYLILIRNPTIFYATTSTADDPLAGAGYDTQLWLWQVDATPLLGNDDSPNDSPTFSSFLSGPAVYTSHPGHAGAVVDPLAAEVAAPGVYVLSIGGFANDPQDAAGVDLFTLGLDFDALWGPNPAAGPFFAWQNVGATGSYTIALQGVNFIPAPGALVLLGISGLAGIRRRRRA